MIYGAKKGSKGQQKPNVAKDTTASTNYFQGLYGLSEGEVFGLVDGGKSIKLDGTPLINDNGQPNFQNVSWEFRNGTVDQEHIKGFSSVENEQSVGVELRHNRPFTRAISNTQLSAVVIRLNWGALREQKDNGDIVGYKIAYAIDVQTDGGAWTTALNTSINDKASQGYQRSHRIDLPTARRGWTVRVRRITPNRDSDLIADTMSVQAITEVIDAKLRYPCTSLLALKYDAETFGNVAKVAVRMRGMIVQVPSNYNAQTRTYTGVWDGTFKPAYTNNPAWVFYDLCTAKRYGLGERLAGKVDKWSLYALGQYCDELVDDGKGGKEPRFTVNVYIQKAQDAYQILQNLASVFRAMSYWDGVQIIVDADTPKEPVYTFTNANVVNGAFSYTGTRKRDRHSIAKVAYDDPDNEFKTDYVHVRDEFAIAKYGISTIDINAFGCTSRAQAYRAGAWALQSEQLETETVTFSAGLDGFIPKVGEVINVSDNARAGRANGGRVVSASGRTVTLDREAGKVGDTFVVNGADGQAKTAKITAIRDVVITLDKVVGAVAGAVWAMTSSDLAPRQFRVMSIKQNDDSTFDITGLQYEPSKFSAADNGARAIARPVSVIKPQVLGTPSNIIITSHSRVVQGQNVTTLTINWAQVQGAVGYIVEWRKDDNAWQALPTIASQSVDIDGVYSGNYQARVRAVDAFDNQSLMGFSDITRIEGKQGKPPRLANLTVQGVLFGMELGWLFGAKSEDTNFTEIQVSPDGRSNIATLGTFAYPTNKHEITGLQGNLTQFYRGRIVDKLGNTSDWTAWQRGTTSADAGKVLELISGQINSSHLDQTLRTPIARIGELQSAVDGVNAQLPTLNSQLATANRELQTAISNITTERNRISSAIRDITALQSANNAKTQEIANLTQTVGSHTSSIRELGVTTGDLSQKYAQIKTQADNATSEISAIKQTQAGQATSIDKLGARFDSLAVGGRNLILQSSQTLTVAPHGASNRENQQITMNVANIDWTTVKQLTLSVDVKHADDLVRAGNRWWRIALELVVRHTDGTTSYPKAMITAPVATAFNGRVTYVWDIPKEIRTINYAVIFVQNINSSHDIIIANPKLEIGNVPTDWTPAPEDVNVDLSPYATTASLDEFKQASANADNALSQRINTLDAQYKKADTDLTARIAREENARANGDNANAQALRTLESTVQGVSGRVGTSESKIATLERTTADTNQALATAQNQLKAKFDSFEVGGRNLLLDSKSRQRPVRDNSGYNYETYTLTEPLVIGQSYTFKAKIEFTQGQSDIVSVYDYRGGVARHLTVKDDYITTTFVATSTEPSSFLVYAGLSGATHNKAINITHAKLERGTIATDWTPAPEDVDSNIRTTANAAIDEYKRTQVDASGRSVAERVATLESTTNGQKTSIQNVERSINGTMAIKAVTVDNNGFISGYGLMSDLQNGQVTSSFGINADTIYFGATSSAKKPFVFTTRTSVIDGVTYPAGAWFNTAHIANASIKLAHIDKASINSLSALSADIGTLRTSDSRGTFTYTGSKIELRDPRGRLLLEMGLL